MITANIETRKINFGMTTLIKINKQKEKIKKKIKKATLKVKISKEKKSPEENTRKGEIKSQERNRHTGENLKKR